MSVAENQYFALLRSALWDLPVDIDGAIDWNAVMKIAEFHGNNVLLADLAARMDDNRPSTQMLGRMQMAMRDNLIHHLRLRQIMVSAVKLLREHNIEPVLLKGFGLAMLYPNPSLRQFGDIDLFVGLNDFHEACTLLRTLPGGYNWGEEIDAGKHYNIEFGQYPMEIHRVSSDIADPKEHALYAAMEQDGLLDHPQRVDFEGLEISIPSKEFAVFFTFYHAWHHFLTTGVGWRQLSDVTMTLHAYHGQLDLDKLKQWLDSMHLMTPWQTFGYLMVDHLGLPAEEMPFYDAACRRRATKLYQRIMKEGNFKRENNYKRKKPKSPFWHKVHAVFGIFVDFFHRFSVFPSHAFREMVHAFKMGLGKNLKKK